MSKFNLFSHRIFKLIGLFSLPIITTIAIASNSVAFPREIIAQRITSPGLTKPISPPVSASPVEESPVIIPVPLPKNSLPSSTQPTTSTPPKFATNHTNRVFSAGERDKIVAYLRSRNVSSSSIVSNLPNTPDSFRSPTIESGFQLYFMGR